MYINMWYDDEEWYCRDELIEYIADRDGDYDRGIIEIQNFINNVEELNQLFNPYGIYIRKNIVEFNSKVFPMLSLALFLCAREEVVNHIDNHGLDIDLYKLIVANNDSLFSRDSFDYTLTNALYTSFGLFLLKEKEIDFHSDYYGGIVNLLAYHTEFNEIKDHLLEFLDLLGDTINNIETVRCSVNHNYSTLGKELNLVEKRVNILVEEWNNE